MQNLKRGELVLNPRELTLILQAAYDAGWQTATGDSEGERSAAWYDRRARLVALVKRDLRLYKAGRAQANGGLS